MLGDTNRQIMALPNINLNPRSYRKTQCLKMRTLVDMKRMQKREEASITIAKKDDPGIYAENYIFIA